MLTKVIGVSKNSKLWCKRRFRRVLSQISAIESRNPLSSQFKNVPAIKKASRNHKR